MEPTVRQRAFRRLFEALIALCCLLVLGTIGYQWLEGMALIDAMYMAVITISTVGFGEVQELSPSGRLFTMALIVGGGGIAAYSLSAAAEFFLSGEWRVQLEQRRRQRMVDRLTNHTIVCGYGRMGRHVVEELKAQHLDFIVIEPDEEAVEELQATGDLVICGDASDEADLSAAGIEQARSLVAVASSDADNVFIVLTARNLRPDLLIIARANSDRSEEKLLRAGADRVLLPYRISGRRIVTLLVRPDVADFFDEVMHTNQLELLVDQVYLAPTSPLVGQSLEEAHLRNTLGVTILACRLPGEQIIISPSAQTILRPGAQLIVLGTREQLLTLLELTHGTPA